MKKLLIRTIVFLTLVIFCNSSCKEKDYYMNDGIITGYDSRKCMCCSGPMITFTNDPKPYSAEFRLIDNEDFLEISADDKFPIYLKVDWKVNTENACGRIIITRFVRR